MKPIKIKSAGVTLASLTFSALGLLTWVTAKDNNVKNLGVTLFFGSSTTGLVSKCKSWGDELDINEKVEKLLEKERQPITNLQQQVQRLSEINLQLTATNQKLQESLDLQQELTQLGLTDLEAIKGKLGEANKKLTVKELEIESLKTATDTRFQDLLGEFIIKLLTDFENWMVNIYDQQNNNAHALLQKEDYANIHTHLQKYQGELETKFAFHRELLTDIVAVDIRGIATLLQATEVGELIISRILQIAEEIAALKVRYRYIQSLDERLELWKYQQKKLVSLEQAQGAVDDFSEFHHAKVDELEALLNDNESFTKQNFAEMQKNLDDLLGKLEEAQLKVNELSKPIMWKFALNHATKAGNIIIQYAQSLRIHLDRSHYTGDVYSADLHFFTDRINASQTVDIKALNEEGEKIAQIANLREPVQFSYDYDSRLVIAHIVMQLRESEKKADPLTKAKQFIKPPEALIPFIRDSYHVGLWAATGSGKTTAIANIIGGMIIELSESGTAPTIRLTIPKIDADTQKIFPEVHWLGIPESIFGLLEAALEIQYRIHKSEQAFRAKELIQDYDPILFFIDEINLIFTRWRSINDNDLENVLDRFEATLAGDRLVYFREIMRTELANYKGQFASRLLLFIWQTGRSLRVKSLIAGQNLMPSKLGLNVSDLDNCAYMSFGDSIEGCTKYKVREVDEDTISKQYNVLQKALETDDNLKYTALYCPTIGKAYFGSLPAPNYYQWSADLLQPTNTNHKSIENPLIEIQTQAWQSLDGLDAVDVRTIPELDAKAESVYKPVELDGRSYKTFKQFDQLDKLPEKYQNLGYEGFLKLWQSLPKKVDGTVKKMQAYTQVFDARRSDEQKLFSKFIDWLEANFK